MSFEKIKHQLFKSKDIAEKLKTFLGEKQVDTDEYTAEEKFPEKDC